MGDRNRAHRLARAAAVVGALTATLVAAPHGETGPQVRCSFGVYWHGDVWTDRSGRVHGGLPTARAAFEQVAPWRFPSLPLDEFSQRRRSTEVIYTFENNTGRATIVAHLFDGGWIANDGACEDLAPGHRRRTPRT